MSGKFKGRREDFRLVTGQGKYTSDWNLPGQLHGYFLRSDRAHAEIISIDTKSAQSSPGVVAVFTGVDTVKAGFKSSPNIARYPGRGGMLIKVPHRDGLASGRVRHVGQEVAFVVATSALAAQDAAEKIEIEYRELPVVVDAEAALAPGAEQLYPDIPGNLCFDYEYGDEGKTNEVFAQAAHVTRVVLDLKAEVKPQVFTLKPIADYGHRLVLDLYPVVPPDPLAALIELDGKIAGGAPEPAPAAKGAKPKVARLATIVIDAGHGGEDPGARGRRGSREKDITLMIARRLKGLVDAEPEMRAVLTRDGDFYLPLNTRVEKARRVRADLFVSVHADAFVRPHARGSSVFTLSQRPTSEAARWLAKQENDADLVGGVNLDGKDRFLAQTLLDLSQTATTDHSLKLGGAVLAELGQINTLHKARVEQAGFAVLKAPDVPSILVETAFISNPEEEKRLNDQAYQDKLARAILEGIKDYIARNPPRPSSPLALR